MPEEKEDNGSAETLEKEAMDGETLQEQITTLKRTLEEMQEKADSHWDLLLRKEADLQNMQRRHQQELAETQKFALVRFARELLQVMDSLEQGILCCGPNASVADLLEGVKLTQAELVKAFEKQGITVVEAEIGQVFDPQYHEAIAMQETPEGEPNRIVAVVQKGYLCATRLLRPARVIVSKVATNGP